VSRAVLHLVTLLSILAELQRCELIVANADNKACSQLNEPTVG
jgi:hypothetical protein